MPTKTKEKKTHKKKKREIKVEWKELKNRKGDFVEIIKILNRFYCLSPGEEKSPSVNFREEICESKLNDLSIFIQKFGDYEFLIKVIISKGKSDKQDSWIHIDGIQQEREELLRSGIKEHPVFQLICITDLYKVSKNVEE